MAARTPHPILAVAQGLDALPPIPANTEPACFDRMLREREARAPFDAAADRFAAAPGPAAGGPVLPDATARGLAVGFAAYALIGLGLLAASILRMKGLV